MVAISTMRKAFIRGALTCALVALGYPAAANAAQNSCAPIPPDVQKRAQQAVVLDRSSRPLTSAGIDWVARVSREPGSCRIRVALGDPSDDREFGFVMLDADAREIEEREVADVNELPPRLSERDAITIASADSHVKRVGRKFSRHLDARASLEDRTIWIVDFTRKGDDAVVMRANVSDATGVVEGPWTGHAIEWEMARGERGAFGGDMVRTWVWWPLGVVFIALLINWRTPRTWHTVDVLLVASFMASWEFFVRANLEWSVPLAFISLAALTTRAIWLFMRGVPAAVSQPLLPAKLLWCVAIFLAGVRTTIALTGGNVIDVGFASVTGADLIAAGALPWGAMPDAVGTGDTYGPLAYLAYVPFVLATHFDGEWTTTVPAAQYAALVWDFACAALLALIGWRFMGQRAAALLVAAWMAFPFSALVLATSSNDSLVAMFVLASIALLPKAMLRGAAMALAGAVKFLPLLALPVLVRVASRSSIARVAVGATLVIAACGMWLAVSGDGLQRFWDATFGYQYARVSPFSPWGLYDLRIAQIFAQVLVVAGVCAMAWWPRERDFRQVCAGIAATLLASQLVLQHWFYLYLPWAIAPMLVVLVAGREWRAASARSGK